MNLPIILFQSSFVRPRLLTFSVMLLLQHPAGTKKKKEKRKTQSHLLFKVINKGNPWSIRTYVAQWLAVLSHGVPAQARNRTFFFFGPIKHFCSTEDYQNIVYYLIQPQLLYFFLHFCFFSKQKLIIFNHLQWYWYFYSNFPDIVAKFSAHWRLSDPNSVLFPLNLHSNLVDRSPPLRFLQFLGVPRSHTTQTVGRFLQRHERGGWVGGFSNRVWPCFHS